MSAEKYFAVVPAAGVGARMGAELPKQYLQCAGRAVIEHTLQRLLAFPLLEQIVVALSAEDIWFGGLPISSRAGLSTCIGGSTRAASVLAGLEALSAHAGPDDWVLVHDAARPCISSADLERLMNELAEDPCGGLLAAPVADTVKLSDAGQRVSATLDRSTLWLAQTPQMFRYGLLCESLLSALASQAAVTDEAMAVELAGHSPKLVAGSAANLKITRPADLVLAEQWLYLEDQS